VWRRSAALAVCALLARASTSSALNPLTLISQYAADYWRTADGLPQATVGAIAQTADGYIWLATEEGLVRFDGVRFSVLDTTNSALTDNYISSLRAGRDGSLWIRTPAALYRYRAGHLRSVCTGRSVGLDFTPIFEDASGTIWSGDVGGVTAYTPKGECRHYSMDAAAFDATVTSLVETGDGSLLIGTTSGLKQFSGGSIVDAKAFTTSDGFALDVFSVQDSEGEAFGDTERLTRLRQTIEKTLRGEIRPRRELARKTVRSRASAFSIKPKIIFDNEASRIATVIEVECLDRPGLLYDITHAIFEAGLSISTSMVATYGERAIDVFYVRDGFGHKIVHPTRLEAVERRLKAAVGPRPLEAPTPAKA